MTADHAYSRLRDFLHRHRPTLALGQRHQLLPRRRLVVRMIARRRTVFDLIKSERVDFRQYSPSEDFRSANVAVIPIHTAWLDWVRTRVPWIVWRRAAAGRLALVFDASAEGTDHDPARTRELHALLAEKGVDPRRCLYLTQNREYASDYRAYCEANGLDHRVAIYEYDYFLSRFFKDYAADGAAAFEERLAAFEARPARRERMFFSVNRLSRPSRILLMLSLIRDGLFEQGFISFGGLEGAPPGEPPWVFADRIQELAAFRPTLARYGSVRFPSAGRQLGTEVRLAADLATDFYDRTWFSIVTETEMTTRAIRITEKPLKPLANLHPFVVLGNPGALAFLRGLGFSTFAPSIDERYDEESDPVRRFDLGYGEIQRLCALDDAALRRLELDLRETLVANARHALIALPKIYNDVLDDALLDRIEAATPL